MGSDRRLPNRVKRATLTGYQQGDSLLNFWRTALVVAGGLIVLAEAAQAQTPTFHVYPSTNITVPVTMPNQNWYMTVSGVGGVCNGFRSEMQIQIDSATPSNIIASPPRVISIPDGFYITPTQISFRNPSILSPVSITLSLIRCGTTTFSPPASGTMTITPVPDDSFKLRQMQIAGTLQSAQLSGQAITGAIDNAIQNGFGNNVQSVVPNGSGLTFNFAADENDGLSATPGSDAVKRFVVAPDGKHDRQIDDAFSALGYAYVTKAPAKPTVPQRDWLGWLDLRGVSVSNDTTGADLRGNQVNLTAGLTRKLTPDFLVGAVGGYERLDFNSEALNSRLKGNGWTVGGYIGWRIAPSVRFDAALARTGVDYSDIANTAAASFPGNRWLISGGLTGTYQLQGLVLQPSARVYALWEHDGAYTDSLGTAWGTNDFSTGRASVGSKLSYPVEWMSSIALAPYIGAYGDYYFSNLNPAGALLLGPPTPAVLLQGGSARVISGVAVKFNGGGQITAGGELGGIGSNTNTRVWTYRINGSVPF